MNSKDIGWQPAFPGQREPFEPGNAVAETHGSRSERRVAPLAAEIERTARADPSWPDYLQDAGYAAAVHAWCRSEAVIALLWEYVGEQDLSEWLADTSREESTEDQGKGTSTRTTTARRQGSALEALRRWESIAGNRRRDLGLDPTSRAKFARDRAVTTAVANRLHDLAATGAGLVAAARERGALSATQSTEQDHGAPDDEEATRGDQ